MGTGSGPGRERNHWGFSGVQDRSIIPLYSRFGAEESQMRPHIRDLIIAGEKLQHE